MLGVKLEVISMMNFRNTKTKRIIAAVIVILIVLAMVTTTIIGALM